MTKLIRLTTTDQNCYFDNTFNEDIIIEPQSQIALQSLTTQIATEALVIDAQNDLITFSINGNASGAPKNIHMQHGTYTKENIASFFSNLTTQFNTSLNQVTKEIGRQWKIGTVNNYVVFNMETGQVVDPLKENNKQEDVNVSVFELGVNKFFKRDGGTDTTDDAFMYFKTPNCKGASQLKARIYNNDGTTNGGFIIGYLENPPDTNTTVIDPVLIKYGVKFIDPAVPYRKIIDGVDSVVTGAIPYINSAGSDRNDNIVIETANGLITGKRYSYNHPSGTVLFQEAYDHETNLFPIIVFVSSYSQLMDIAFTSDPFYNITNTVDYIDREVENISAVPRIDVNSHGNCYLFFDDFDIAKAFGFKIQRLPVSGFVVPDINGSLTFTSVNMFRFRDISDAYLVELLNIKIDSYDSIKQQRMNLLHVIPQFDIVQERLIYSTQYPLYLALNNPYPINLREIKARLLKEDLSEVASIGYSQMTILIQKIN
jgi:hypothetical protein